MEREQRETVGCCRRSTNSAVCYGERRNSQGNLGTDRLFTGQRLDDTGLYYYRARYYDPTIGRFISADTIVPDFANPQAYNRYSYVLNNPLKYTDSSGHFWDWAIDWAGILYDAYEFNRDPSWGNAGLLALDVVLAVVPFVPAGAGLAVKAAKRGDDVFDAVKGIFKSSDEASEGVEYLTKSRRNARENLRRKEGFTKEEIKGQEAHHELPVQHEKKFKNSEINIHDPERMSFRSRAEHHVIHDEFGYNARWEAFFEKNPYADAFEIEQFHLDLRYELRKFGKILE